MDARQVLVTVGTVSSVSALGTTEVYRAFAENDIQRAASLAAVDAGLATCNWNSSKQKYEFNDNFCNPILAEELARKHHDDIIKNVGIRHFDVDAINPNLPVNIAAFLPETLRDSELSRIIGLQKGIVRDSIFSDMVSLLVDDKNTGPSLQSKMLLYAGLSSIASLPTPLHQLLRDPSDFQVVTGGAFSGLDSMQKMLLPMQPEHGSPNGVDKFALRLAASLNTHGPALLSTMLAPSISISKVRRDPRILDILNALDKPLYRIPQCPIVSSAACASAISAFNQGALQAVASYPGMKNTEMFLWSASDAPLGVDARILEGFGPVALMTTNKLKENNRCVSDCLAPFDVDASGTVIGSGGSAVIVTNLEFAVNNMLPITSIVAGWGQSGESGGKAHFAGVGYGGENALISALMMAYENHGLTVKDFEHLIAHATGTRTNSKTELNTLRRGRMRAQELQGVEGRLPKLTVSATKAVGDGHTMGETSLKASGEAIQYVLGNTVCGIPTLRKLDPELDIFSNEVKFQEGPISGNPDSGAIVVTQGFGGYVGAMVFRSFRVDQLEIYNFNKNVNIDEYKKQHPHILVKMNDDEKRIRSQSNPLITEVQSHAWT